MSFSEFFMIMRGTGFLYGLFGGNTALWLTVGALISAIVAYLLGSINFAIMISQKEYHQDIRTHGSGNAGMTNMMRTYGRRAAILTFIGDAMKAIVAGIVGYLCLGYLGAHIAGVFCVVGHMYPVFFKFKGGKGVVTTAASMLVCNPYVFLIELVIYVLTVVIWKYISLASIMCALLYPVILNGMDKFFNVEGVYGIFTVIIAVLVVLKHKENIKRLLNGTESRFTFKKSVKKEEVEEENIEN